jgi:hypothetical protein
MSARTAEEQLAPAGDGVPRGRPVAQPRLEPREAGAILDLAIEGLLARLTPAFLFALALWVPFRQVAELLGLSGLTGFEANLAAIVWNAAAMIPTGFTASVVVSLVGDALSDPRAPLGPAFARGLARGAGVVALMILTHVVALPLILLCVAPFFLVQWLTWAAVPVFVLEGEGLLTPAERAHASRHPLAWLVGQPVCVVRALRRSAELSKGVPAFVRWLLLWGVGQLALGGLLDLGALALTDPSAREFLRGELSLSSAAADLALGGAAAFFTALSSALRAALTVAFYLDLRVRREGWDLERALGSAAEARA